MAKEEQGLVIRGLGLLAVIGALVMFVGAILFRQTPEPPPRLDAPPEPFIPLAMAPGILGYPASVSWFAMYELSTTLPSAPGWEVRYNAAATLARRGSPRVPWPLIREMLDEKQQMRNCRVPHPDGRVEVDESAARAYMLSALKAVAAWHEKQPAEARLTPGPELQAIYALVDQLTLSPFEEMKLQAKKARSTFFR